MIMNSLSGPSDPLTIVPNSGGIIPTAENIEVPGSILNLVVAGNEALPNGQPNDWNRHKSRALLKFYGEPEDSESDAENPTSEFSSRSRNRRLRVAKVLGITKSQLRDAFVQINI
jgi:hypothetical protein